MKHKTTERSPCSICKREFSKSELRSGTSIRSQLQELIIAVHPDWEPSGYICFEDLTKFRMQYVRDLLKSEKGELTSLEQEVLQSLEHHELISDNLDEEGEKEWSLGEKLADRIATFGGSWTFLLLFGGFLFLWILSNSIMLLGKPVDPYPYILLNLLLSCLAAIQAPIIMMSQNRQEAKDRNRSEHDYKVNLKAELEIRHLHEKIDHLLSHQWDRLIEIQQMQLELLNELGAQKEGSKK
ncbi:MAG: DUF1003 domain-containing protein [Bdellovibrionales bacterium]|nr:DUF1003 domain-containing protein [Bdellovibrionales bacterium]